MKNILLVITFAISSFSFVYSVGIASEKKAQNRVIELQEKEDVEFIVSQRKINLAAPLQTKR